MRVLVVRLGAFGDIVHTLPLAADLAAAGHEVGWVLEDRWRCVIDGSPVVRRIHTVPRKALRGASPLRRRILALRRLVRELRAARYDAVIDAQGLAKSALISFCAGARLRIGHARPRAREMSWIVASRRVAPDAEHVIDQQRALGRALGLSAAPCGAWSFPMPAWDEQRAWARAWLARRGLRLPWVLNVGAGWPTKVWPVTRQIEFAKLLRERRRPLLCVWGSHEEHDIAEEVIAEARHGELAPPTTIPQLAALLAGAAVVVSGDTGPLHLARALGTPAVGLFGPVPATRNGPIGRGYRTLQAPGAAWERRDVSRVDMAAIGAGAVIAAADAAVAEVP